MIREISSKFPPIIDTSQRQVTSVALLADKQIFASSSSPTDPKESNTDSTAAIWGTEAGTIRAADLRGAEQVNFFNWRVRMHKVYKIASFECKSSVNVLKVLGDKTVVAGTSGGHVIAFDPRNFK